MEERVKGVKGVECSALTEEINKALGEVYESKPTAEMYEQKIEVEVEAENTVSESWSGSSTVSARARISTASRVLPPLPRAAACFVRSLTRWVLSSRSQWGNAGGSSNEW